MGAFGECFVLVWEGIVWCYLGVVWELFEGRLAICWPSFGVRLELSGSRLKLVLGVVWGAFRVHF